VEFALLIPPLIFFLLGATDFCRLFYYYVTVHNCARNGALWAADPLNDPLKNPLGLRESRYASVDLAAKADAPAAMQGQMPPARLWSDASGSNVTVEVTYPFATLVSYPGMPSTVNLTSQVTMRVLPPY
jgi:Flp pilus assembly protein TadG